MQLFIRHMLTETPGKTTAVEIKEHETVKRLKEIIHEKEGIPMENIHIFYRAPNFYMEDDRTIGDYDLKKNPVKLKLVTKRYSA